MTAPYAERATPTRVIEGTAVPSAAAQLVHLPRPATAPTRRLTPEQELRRAHRRERLGFALGVTVFFALSGSFLTIAYAVALEAGAHSGAAHLVQVIRAWAGPLTGTELAAVVLAVLGAGGWLFLKLRRGPHCPGPFHQ